jgi:hypothetical protein
MKKVFWGKKTCSSFLKIIMLAHCMLFTPNDPYSFFMASYVVVVKKPFTKLSAKSNYKVINVNEVARLSKMGDIIIIIGGGS